MLFTYLAFGFVAPLSILLCLIVLLWGWKFRTVWFRGGVWLKQALRQGHSVAILLIWLCESTSIDKDAMALKVFQHIIIFLFTFVKYTCPREKNSKIIICLSYCGQRTDRAEKFRNQQKVHQPTCSILFPAFYAHFWPEKLSFSYYLGFRGPPFIDQEDTNFCHP